ncbi:MAG: DNA polymerase/3'-5' exonuclease PolX [Phycisphaeraceae bacterium]|nr:DNA polymerase/3'-5' exonuclease PolX [Phycisphaeraceae bacterium]MCB9848849.1 DNA polymerase/3'-5' exonuclease PolX [Phycisphaeraceae bacterium]
MGFNADVAAALERMGETLELLGESGFKVVAHSRAARVIRDYPQDLRSIASDEKALVGIEGVGKGIAKKIAEFAQTGKIAEADKLAAQVPAGLFDVLALQGLGPKTVRAMWQELGIESVADLSRAIDDGSLAGLPRMGAKTIENIRESIRFASATQGRTRIGTATAIAEMVLERLRQVEGVDRVEIAGSLRRGRETIGDLDFLAVAQGAAAERCSEAFRTMDEVERVLAAGETKSSVQLKIDRGSRSGPVRIGADLRVVPAEVFGSAWLYFTGSKSHNVRLRERAQKKKLTLNEYGLFPDDGEPAPQSRGVKPRASATETSIYKALGLPVLPPEIREDRGELELKETPALIEADDLIADLHAHTVASDGRLTIDELAQEAKSRGYKVLAITDHSQSQAIANGLKPDRLREHIGAIREADSRIKGIRLLAGSEVDILAGGKLDYEDDLLAELDVVVASPHLALKQTEKHAMKRMLRAIEHPLVHIIGHPTGRLINRREGLPLVIDEIVAAAAEHDVALEINANDRRLDLRDTHVRAAVEGGALLSINCDAHDAGHFDMLPYGVATGRRGWLTADRCINAWGERKLLNWLASKR